MPLQSELTDALATKIINGLYVTAKVRTGALAGGVAIGAICVLVAMYLWYTQVCSMGDGQKEQKRGGYVILLLLWL